MARIALISDIHANAEALERVLEQQRRIGADTVVCLGDVVGYGPEPGRCIELVYEHCDVCVLGNHDEALLLEHKEEAFNPKAREALRFTRDLLDDWHLTMLRLMPDRATRHGVAFSHGSFGKARFDYLYTVESAARSFAGFDERYGAVGHTHIPSIFTCAGDVAGRPADVRLLALAGSVRSRLPLDRRVILNPGSVGQPRDRNPHASWGLLDTDEGWFEVHRVAYDIDSVGEKMLEAGLPDYHSRRLKIGA
ncbi:MAG: metallophosphoesterase family protein [Phycisphaerales bacterium]